MHTSNIILTLICIISLYRYINNEDVRARARVCVWGGRI